jgi:hypothetical protein
MIFFLRATIYLNKKDKKMIVLKEEKVITKMLARRKSVP